MTDPRGVNLLPASGEWVYDPLPHRATGAGQSRPVVLNRHADPDGGKTDYTLAIDQLQARYPGCASVSLVVAWFGNSTDAARCAVYPATVVAGAVSEALVEGAWVPEPWCCAGVTAATPGLVPLSTADGAAAYGGTPSDPAVVRCIRDLKARGLRVTFYPFLLMDCAGFPWRGRITLAAGERTAAVPAAVAAFMGTAAPAQFRREAATVAYAGAATDWTYRRMILHYANLCAVAGGVDLFLLGSELRGLETLRGPAWTRAGATDAGGRTVWDYPFVAALAGLAADVRATFDAAGLARDAAGLKNLVAYSADWSVWMGVQHADAAGQWPHLDALYAHPAVDLVSFDNYLPLSDWTSGSGGRDVAAWALPAPTSWPPDPAAAYGLGLAGQPTLRSKAYLKANIEGGEKYHWFYADSSNGGPGLDPAGSEQRVSRPAGDRLAQDRRPYAPGQEILANKHLRWWWNNPHRAVYDAGDGQGAVPRGGPSAWVPRSKPITFAEYGFPSCDKGTNQPNLFYDARSAESGTPFWSIWDPAPGAALRPRRDDLLARLALEAVTEYWTQDGRNERSPAGVPMVEPAFMAAWNWDARPFPAFPALGVWGDAGNWATGTWLGGKGVGVAAPDPDAAPGPPAALAFPALGGLAWSVTYRPRFATGTAAHATGRESRAGRRAAPLWQVALSADRLDAAVADDLRRLVGFYAQCRGGCGLVLFPLPAELGQGPTLLCRFADDALDLEAFAQALWAARSLTLQAVRG